MYSASNVSVDKGLGFDFSALADLAKNAATVGLNVYQNQTQLKQIKAMGQASQQYGYNVPVVQLPQAQAFNIQPTFGQPVYPMPQRTGMDTGTMLMIGGVVVGGILLFKVLKG